MEYFLLIEFKVSACVVIGDVLNHASEGLAVVGQLSVLDVVSEQVAEQTAEVLMTRIAQEGAAVGKHPDEAREQSEC